jgi:glycosyltransferase involved in cell wall biosynthesis
MTPDRSDRRAADALVSIVLPVFNEAGILQHLTDRIREVMQAAGQPFELVYVDDGSSDDSSPMLDALAANDPRIVAVHLSRNFGHQAAVHAGLQQARGAMVIVMDSDLQDNPQAIPQFLEQWEAGFDVVYAERFNRKEAAWKRLLFYGFYRLLNAIADTRIPRDAGNFGLLDRRVVNTLLKLPESDRYFAGLRSWVGFRQTAVPVERDARYDDKARVSLGGLFRLAKTAIFSFSTFPLTLFSVLAALSAGVCITSIGFVIWHKLVTGLAIPGWASVMITASFFGTLNALGISVLGEYVNRIYNEVRRRPIHLVARVTNGNTDELLESATQAVSEQRLLDMVQQIDRTLTSDSESSPVVAGAVDEPFVAHGPNRTSNRF